MLSGAADPLGGVTYTPLHARTLDEREAIRRLMRHVMAAAIMEKEIGDLAEFASVAPAAAPFDASPAGDVARVEQTLVKLAADVSRGLAQWRRRNFQGLQELADRIPATVEQLKQQSVRDPEIALPVYFLDWKIRMMPAYQPDRVFQENARELTRAAKALAMARELALKVWSSQIL